MQIHQASAALILTIASLPGGAAIAQTDLVAVDSAQLMADLATLADPGLEGRAPGSSGSLRAREYIKAELEAAGAEPVDDDWFHPFHYGRARLEGVNVVSQVRGTRYPDRYVVVTAHYDHLGNRSGTVYPGADDNASGVAVLLSLARSLAASRPDHSVLLVALDAEEAGLQGATAFVADPPVEVESILLNVNLDMVSRSDGRGIYAAGTYHFDFLEPLLDELTAVAPMAVHKGHDRPDGSAGDDWTPQSDHAAFFRQGIPFVYFGVEDHPDYHRPTDTVDRVDPGEFVAAARTIHAFVRLVDERFPELSGGI